MINDSVGYCLSLTQIRVIWEERTSAKELPPLGWL